jgi:nucleotide-binding universal stress UspA family protein
MTDSKAPVARRRKFLVVVDETPESKVALRFAARRAEHTNGLVTLMHVIQPADFQHWMAVERVMREEAHREAEAILHDAARDVKDLTGITPEVVIKEGQKKEQVLELLKEDPDISILVLGAGIGTEGPGPLVALVASEAAQSYPIPVTIVPGSLTEAQVDELA